MFVRAKAVECITGTSKSHYRILNIALDERIFEVLLVHKVTYSSLKGSEQTFKFTLICIFYFLFFGKSVN